MQGCLVANLMLPFGDPEHCGSVEGKDDSTGNGPAPTSLLRTAEDATLSAIASAPAFGRKTRYIDPDVGSVPKSTCTVQWIGQDLHQ